MDTNTDQELLKALRKNNTYKKFNSRTPEEALNKLKDFVKLVNQEIKRLEASNGTKNNGNDKYKIF